MRNGRRGANAPGSAAGPPAVSPSAADAANIVAVLKQLSQTPAVRKAIPNINLASLADQATQLQTIVLAHAPAATHTILDLLPGSMQSLAPALAPIVGTLVPGFGGSSLRSASAPPCRSSATGSSPRVRRIIGPPPTSAASARCRRMSGREASLLFSNGLSRDRPRSAPRLRGEGIRPPARRSCNRLEAEKTWST